MITGQSNFKSAVNPRPETRRNSFKHYFVESEVDVFKKAMKIVYTINFPRPDVKFIIDCDVTTQKAKEDCGLEGPNPDDKVSVIPTLRFLLYLINLDMRISLGDRRYASTDSTVSKGVDDVKTITICPYFWHAPDVSRSLPSSGNKDKLNEFCGKDDIKDFVTPGKPRIILSRERPH